MFQLTPTVKNLLIVTVVVFILQQLLSGLYFTETIALYRIGSMYFEPYQFFTYMFAHADFFHILFNMIGLIIFGVALERMWGAKKFLIFYLATGMISGILYTMVGYYQIYQFQDDFEAYRANPTVTAFNELANNHNDKFDGLSINGQPVYEFIEKYENNPDANREKSIEITEYLEDKLVYSYQGRVIGASGAVYGILMAFGLLFPERQLMLLFPPIPIKAKYLVLILGGLAIFNGLQDNPGDNVAHLVHLGGMLVGAVMVKFF